MKEYSERQEQIISAAIELISDKGIQQMTTKNLASKLSLSEGAIYRHFKSKNEILLGIINTLHSIKFEAINTISSLDKKDAPEKINTFFSCCLKKLVKNRAIAAVIFAEEIFKNDNDLSQETYLIMEDTRAVVRKIVRDGQIEGTVRKDISADYASVIITGSMRLLVTRWRLSGYEFDLINEGTNLLKNIQILIKN